MTHGSLFAGVEGFGLGFQQAGYETIWQVEREPYCIAVLKTRFPNVERYYDIKDCGIGRKHKLGAVDVVTAGFPCQDLSVAGKRAGLAGARSGLFWEVIRLVGELRPRWLVLENVPGLFSSLSDDEENGIQTLGLRGEWDSLSQTDDFETVLTTLGELGIFQSIAWTVLDSQYFGVAQRRRRVFIVCGPGVGSAEQVLFEREGCEGDFTQSSEARPSAAGEVARSITQSCWKRHDEDTGTLIAHAISASAGHHGHSSPRGDGSGNLIPIAFGANDDGRDIATGISPTLRCGGKDGGGVHTAVLTVGTLKARTGGFDIENAAAGYAVATTLNSGGNSGGFRTEPGEHIVTAPITGHSGWRGEDRDTYISISATANSDRMRDAPRLSEGLDDTRFSLLPEGIDSPRYRALGNAVTVSVAKWIAERIKAVADKERQ